MFNRIAILTTKQLIPPEDGRADTILKRIMLFRKIGCQVTVFSFLSQSVELNQFCTVINIPFRINVVSIIVGILKRRPLQVALYSGKGLIRELQSRLDKNNYDVIISDMIRTALLIKDSSIPRKILDMDDVLSSRYLRQISTPGLINSLGNSPVQLPVILRYFEHTLIKLALRYEAYSLKKFENKIVYKYDRVVLVSQKEAEELKKETGYNNISIIPNYINFPVIETITNKNKYIDLLFFGNLSIAHNIDTAIYLIQELFPAIKKVIPDVNFSMIGRKISPIIFQEAQKNDNISLYENVFNIVPFIQGSRICLSPMRFGSGIKTKILEALYLGTPVITTSRGAEGIPEAKECMIIADTLEEQINNVVAILKDDVDIKSMIMKARQIMNQHFTEKSVENKLRQLLED